VEPLTVLEAALVEKLVELLNPTNVVSYEY
jgi:hypothetical protein